MQRLPGQFHSWSKFPMFKFYLLFFFLIFNFLFLFKFNSWRFLVQSKKEFRTLPKHYFKVSVIIGFSKQYLVNQPLQAAGMSADNLRGCPLRFAFDQIFIFRTVSLPRYIISRHTSKPEEVLIITLPLNLISRSVEWKFCWLLFTFRNSIWDQLFYVITTGLCITFLPCKVIKMKKQNSWTDFFVLALFFSTEIIGGQVSSETRVILW